MKTPNVAKTPLFDAFSSLAQIIHDGDQKFVIIAYPNDPDDPLREELPHLEDLPEPRADRKCVTFEMGEVGGTNRWWYGIWTLDDVKKISGPGGNNESYEYIISNAAKHFIEGYSSVANLAPVVDDSQKTEPTQADSQELSSHLGPLLRIDTKTDVPTITIPLSSLSPSHATSRGNQILWAILSQTAANQEACLFPWRKHDEVDGGDATGGKGLSPSKLQDNSRATELEKQVQYLTGELKKHGKETLAPPPVIQPGRSLGNPTKKARKIQTLVYDDDSEEEEPVKVKKRKTKV